MSDHEVASAGSARDVLDVLAGYLWSDPTTDAYGERAASEVVADLEAILFELEAALTLAELPS